MRLEKVNFTPNFKKDLSNIELYGIEGMINEMNSDESFYFTVEELGLAYTSSSSYAMYNICNGNFYIEEPETSYDEDDNEITTYIEASHFSITENNMLLLVCYDHDENEIFYEVVNH